MNSDHPQFYMSAGETIVRSYESTVRERLFGPPLVGYITISNKRIVYHTQSRTPGRWSTIISELPLDDYSGLSTSLSSTFSWLLFGLFCLVFYASTFILANLLPPFLTGWVFAMILTVPYLVGLLFQKEILGQDVQERFLENLNDIPGTRILRNRDLEYYMRFFRILLGCGLALIAWNIAHDPAMDDQLLFMRFLILFTIYYFIYRHLFANRLHFSLSIVSKSDRNSGIIIPGNPLAQLLSGGTSALASLNSYPGQDAEIIVQELGALLTDIHQLGDLVIQKWLQPATE